jgi:hypothetical protein
MHCTFCCLPLFHHLLFDSNFCVQTYVWRCVYSVLHLRLHGPLSVSTCFIVAPFTRDWQHFTSFHVQFGQHIFKASYAVAQYRRMGFLNAVVLSSFGRGWVLCMVPLEHELSHCVPLCCVADVVDWNSIGLRRIELEFELKLQNFLPPILYTTEDYRNFYHHPSDRQFLILVFGTSWIPPHSVIITLPGSFFWERVGVSTSIKLDELQLIPPSNSA